MITLFMSTFIAPFTGSIFVTTGEEVSIVLIDMFSVTEFSCTFTLDIPFCVPAVYVVLAFPFSVVGFVRINFT